MHKRKRIAIRHEYLNIFNDNTLLQIVNVVCLSGRSAKKIRKMQSFKEKKDQNHAKFSVFLIFNSENVYEALKNIRKTLFSI